jgi:hypothetical protein
MNVNGTSSQRRAMRQVANFLVSKDGRENELPRAHDAQPV